MLSFIYLDTRDEWIQKVIRYLEQQIAKNKRVTWDAKFHFAVNFILEDTTLEEDILSVSSSTNFSEKTFTLALVVLERFLEREKYKLNVHVAQRLFFATLWLAATESQPDLKIKNIKFKQEPAECASTYAGMVPAIGEVVKLNQIVGDLKIDVKSIDSKTIEDCEKKLRAIDVTTPDKSIKKAIEALDRIHPSQPANSSEIKSDLDGIINQIKHKLQSFNKPISTPATSTDIFINSKPLSIDKFFEFVKKYFLIVLNILCSVRKTDIFTNDPIVYILLSAYILFNRFANENQLLHSGNVLQVFETAFLISCKVNEESLMAAKDLLGYWEWVKTNSDQLPSSPSVYLKRATFKREAKFLEVIHWDASISDEDRMQAMVELKNKTGVIKKINAKEACKKLPHFFRIPTLYPLEDKYIAKISRNFYVVDMFYQKVQDKKLTSDPSYPLLDKLVELYERVPLSYKVFLLGYIYFENILASQSPLKKHDWKYVILGLYKATKQYYEKNTEKNKILEKFIEISNVSKESLESNMTKIKMVEFDEKTHDETLAVLNPDRKLLVLNAY